MSQDIPDLMARGIAVIVMVYLCWGLLRVIRGAWRWLRHRGSTALTDVPHAAGKVARHVEDAAAQAAAAFKDGRRR